MVVKTKPEVAEKPPTYMELRGERAEITKEIATLDRELVQLRGQRLQKWEFFREKARIVDEMTRLRGELSLLNQEINEQYPSGARQNDDGRKFWRERAFSLVQSLDAILDDETASPTVKAVVAAAQREYARAMSSHKSVDDEAEESA